MVSVYAKLHLDLNYVWYFYGHLTTDYACWIDIYGPILIGSLFFCCLVASLCVCGFCARCRFCGDFIALGDFYGILWLSVAFLWFLVVSFDVLWLFVFLRLFV